MAAQLAYGRRPAEPERPALEFASFATGAAVRPSVPHPQQVDYVAELGKWKMLGNDRAGDCNAVTWANERRLVTHKLGGRGRYPTQKQVYGFYATQNPDFDPAGSSDSDGPGSAADGGMSVQRGLEYLHRQGGPDGVKAVAFAKVDPSSFDQVQAAVAVFGSLWLGVIVLDGNQAQFEAGQPWTEIPGAGIDGGHAVLAGGYGPDGSVRFVTWGQEATLGDSFWRGSVQGHRLVQEAWVVVWPEHLGSKAFLAGVDQAALRRDYQALTGGRLTLPRGDSV